jgi:hypothetical protein
MDKAEKMDCGANGEILLRTKSPLLSQSPKTCDLISYRTQMKGARKEVRYPMIQAENSDLS